MPHRQKDVYEIQLKTTPMPLRSGKQPVSTVKSSATTPPASWRDELSWSEMSWPTPSPTHCMSKKMR